MIGRRALWRDPSGTLRNVLVVSASTKTATVEYFDNDRRGIRFKAGRKLNHATRIAVVVWQTELSLLPEAAAS